MANSKSESAYIVFSVDVPKYVRQFYVESMGSKIELENGQLLDTLIMNKKKIIGLIINSRLKTRDSVFKMLSPVNCDSSIKITMHHNMYATGTGLPKEEDKQKISYSLVRYCNDCLYLYIRSNRKHVGVDGSIRDWMEEHCVTFEELPLENSRRNYHRWEESLKEIKNKTIKASHYKIRAV